MRLTCPHCGERDHAEFSYRGDAVPQRPPLRPATSAGTKTHQASLSDAMFDYVYLRDNRPGLIRELWQHVGGCRAWLEVERDATTHAIAATRTARAARSREVVR